jgi:hypothetical protein
MEIFGRLLVIASCSLWLLSCASPQLESTIEIHHRLTAADFGKRIVVLPSQKERSGTLEFAEYAKLVEDGLRKEGFQVVPSGEPAELVAFFGYGIDQGRDELYSYAVPQFGQTGVQSSQTFGNSPKLRARRHLQRDDDVYAKLRHHGMDSASRHAPPIYASHSSAHLRHLARQRAGRAVRERRDQSGIIRRPR